MNLFRIKLFIISILFSVNVFANPVRSFIKGVKRWNMERSIKGRMGTAGFMLDGRISEAGKREALDIIASGMEDPLYSSLYSHLEKLPAPELIRLFQVDNPKEATETAVLSLIAMKRHESNWIETIWRQEDRNIFSKLWDVEPARPILAAHIRGDHLIDNPELLLKYWEERGRIYSFPAQHTIALEDRLVYFISSFMDDIKTMGPVMLPFEGLLGRFWESSFGETIIRASGENEGFAEEIQSMVKFIGEGIYYQSDSEMGLAYRETLNRGEFFDQLIQEGSVPRASGFPDDPIFNSPPGSPGLGSAGETSDRLT